MSGHTPGPWRIGKRLSQEVWISGVDKRLHDTWDGLAVAYGCDDEPEVGQDIAEANAHLIAAAPDLLVAAKIRLLAKAITRAEAR